MKMLHGNHKWLLIDNVQEKIQWDSVCSETMTMSVSLTTDTRLLVFVIVQYLGELIINQIGLMFKRENACFSEDFRDLMTTLHSE